MTGRYRIRNVDTLDTPALVIYPDRIRENLRILKSFVDDVSRVRPHVKTNKCPQVVKLMMEAGIRKLKCATIAEAEMLALEGAKDILLAYQPTGPKAIRFCELQRKFPDVRFSCLVDHADVLRALSSVAGEYNQSIRIFIDLNVGMNRTGIQPGHDALQLFRDAAALDRIEFMGLHAYDGHLRDTDLAIREKRCAEAFAPVEDMRQEITRVTGQDPVVVAGGTPTFPIHAKKKDVEASPGTFIFWDHGYKQLLPEQPFEFAALVVTRVISTPDEHTLCLDLGHKSISSENALTQRVHLQDAAGLQPVGHSEEHMVFRSEPKHNYQPGHVFYGVPHHICPTVALYDEAAVCVDGVFADAWPILSRKRKITL